MKVLYITDPGSVGGATKALIEVVGQMKTRGIEPIVCTSVINSLNEQLDNIDIKNISLGYMSVLEPISPYRWKRPIKYVINWFLYRVKLRCALKKIVECIDINSVDLIHTNSARNDLGCYLNKRYGIPHIMHIREFADADFGCITLRENYINIFNKYTTKFVSISNAVRNHWNNKGLNSNKNITIYNGVSYQNIETSNTEDKFNSELKMVIVGGICKAKGQHLIIEALNLLPKNIKSNIMVDFIGWYDPVYLKHLNDLIDKYCLSSNVKFIGELPCIDKILKNYQIGLMCSVSEGFGRVTVEYMFAKLGIIASNSGANPELIKDGETGLLFESGDASSLAKQIVKYFDNRNLLVECTEYAYKHACNKFTKERNAENILKLYNELLPQISIS